MNDGYIVYMHTCPNGKRYIGITGGDPNERWKNGFGYSQNKLFFKEIVQCGWRNIRHDILLAGLTYEEAVEREDFFIALFRTRKRRFGYNKLGGSNIKRKAVVPRQRKVRTHSEETRKKMSEAQKGEKNHNFGKPMSDEQRMLISRSMLNRSREAKGVIINLDTGEVFDNLLDISRKYGVSRTAITNCLGGRSKTAAGFHWKRVTSEQTSTTV